MKRKIKKVLKKYVNAFSAIINKMYFNKMLKNNLTLFTQRNQLKAKLDGEKILILAPHADDETIGCGGALLQFAKNQKNVTLVFLTDSSKRGSVNPGEDIENIRQEEALSAALQLNIPKSQVIFMRGEDKNLINSIDISMLNELLINTNPDTIFLPAPMDTHPDHRNVTSLIMQWTKDYPSQSKQLADKTTIYLYEVQSPITQFYSNITLDITNELGKKEEILALYRSQKNMLNFGSIMDRYYGMLYEISAAEIYIKIPFKHFISMTTKYEKKFKKYDNLFVKTEDQRSLIKAYESSIKYKSLLLKYHT